MGDRVTVGGYEKAPRVFTDTQSRIPSYRTIKTCKVSSGSFSCFIMTAKELTEMTLNKNKHIV